MKDLSDTNHFFSFLYYRQFTIQDIQHINPNPTMTGSGQHSESKKRRFESTASIRGIIILIYVQIGFTMC